MWILQHIVQHPCLRGSTLLAHEQASSGLVGFFQFDPPLLNFDKRRKVTELSRVCLMCHEIFPSPAQKIQHNNRYHFVCEKCPWRSFYSKEALIDHDRASHAQVKKFCTECEAYCTGPRDLRKHMDKYHQDLGNDFDHYPGMHRASCQRQAEAGYDASYSDRNQRTIVTEITFESTGATYGGSVLPETSDRAYQSSSRHHGEYRRPAPRDKTSNRACYKDGVSFGPGLRPHSNHSNQPLPLSPRRTGQHMRSPGPHPRPRPSSPAHNTPIPSHERSPPCNGTPRTCSPRTQSRLLRPFRSLTLGLANRDRARRKKEAY